MNILIPHNWLKDHLKTSADPDTIQKNLSLCGPSIERIEKVDREFVYDIETTTNRVDSTSVRGIAREAAAILPEFGIKSELIPLQLNKVENGVTDPLLPKLDFKIINDEKLCHRVLAIKLENVNIGPSPKWLVDRLEQVGQRSLNSAIDITNYIMWEIGHPIHAFDYDRLTKKTIIVREGKKGEKLTTLDDKTHTLMGGEVVFDDGTGTIVDLPGIMGTKNTVVTKKTKNVLLWIESVDPVKVRQASMGLAIRSQAAVLNEKNVDPALGDDAMLSAIKLYQQVCGATIGSQLENIYPHPQKPKTVTLKESHLNTYMGVHIEPDRVTRILENLGCSVSYDEKSQSFLVTPPSWRSKDITIYQDVIEEIARIYGYHNLPSIIMDTPIPDSPSDQNFVLESKIKSWLASWGASEIYTYSMVSKELAKISGYKIDQHLQIKNPLTDDFTYMRRSIIPSLLQVIHDNQAKDLTVFELQNVYHPNKKMDQLPNEELQLCIVSNSDYAHLKGLIDALLEKLFIKPTIIPSTVSKDGLHPKNSGHIEVEGATIGRIGKIDQLDAYGCIIVFDDLQKVAKTHPKYIPSISTSPIIEDLTFTLPVKTHIGPIIDEIANLHTNIEKVILASIYQQNYTFQITYRDPKNQLTDKNLASTRKKIVAKLKNTYKANLVGKL